MSAIRVRKIVRFCFRLSFLSFLLSASAQASPAQLKQGNRLFKNGRYEDALKAYNDALIDQPNSSILHFNAGDAAYGMRDYANAEKEFAQAAQSAIPLLKSTAHYNRGDAFFREGRLPEAIDAYKDSLRINPNDQDAKYNLSVALRAKANPPSAQPKKGGSGNDSKKPSPGSQGNDQKKEGQGQGDQPKPGQMSREDAERLLSAAGAGEQKKSNQKFQKPDAPHPDEDW